MSFRSAPKDPRFGESMFLYYIRRYWHWLVIACLGVYLAKSISTKEERLDYLDYGKFLAEIQEGKITAPVVYAEEKETTFYETFPSIDRLFPLQNRNKKQTRSLQEGYVPAESVLPLIVSNKRRTQIEVYGKRKIGNGLESKKIRCAEQVIVEANVYTSIPNYLGNEADILLLRKKLIEAVKIAYKRNNRELKPEDKKALNAYEKALISYQDPHIDRSEDKPSYVQLVFYELVKYMLYMGLFYFLINRLGGLFGLDPLRSERRFWREEDPKKKKAAAAPPPPLPRGDKEENILELKPTSFDDVAGLHEAKAEVMEVIDFLKNPKKYETIGSRIPRGLLFSGAPGTGKTLLARAIAWHAQVNFIYISGSDLVSPLVGGGVLRVKSLFSHARTRKKCIIFIDEIETVARKRGQRYSGSGENSEATINHLLTELDGVAQLKKGHVIILIGATNQPQVLDPAILRSGRLDRKILFTNPDLKDRKELFETVLRRYKHDGSIDIDELAIHTAGLVGADIEQICNEAGIYAALQNKTKITHQHLWEALDRHLSGREKKMVLSPEERLRVAVHEAGHALVGWLEVEVSHLTKLTIVPRLGSLGHARYAHPERYITTKEQLLAQGAVSLGGRAAEVIWFGSGLSTGAQSDLEGVTQMLYNMGALYGMSPEVGQVSFGSQSNNRRYFSEKTAERLDAYVRDTIDQLYHKRVLPLIKKHKKQLNVLVDALLEKETLSFQEVEALIGPRPAGAKGVVMRGVAALEKKVSPTKKATTQSLSAQKTVKKGTDKKRSVAAKKKAPVSEKKTPIRKKKQAIEQPKATN